MAKILQYGLCVAACFCFCVLKTAAQKKCTLKFECAAADTECSVISQFDSVFADKAKCIAYIQQLPSLLAARGYISASVDAVKEDSASIQVKLFVGKKYTWDSLIIHDADKDLLLQAGYNAAAFNTKPFDPSRITQLYKRLLNYFSSNGYPFAKIFLDSIQLNNEKIHAALHIDKGSLYYIDSIIITSDKNISKNFLSQYLGIREHDVYRQNVLDAIDKKLADLSFVQQSQHWVAEMLNDGARLHFYLQSKQSNQVNVLVGFLPENQQLGGKLLVTGEADLALRNAFGNAENIALNWQQLQQKSPRLNILFQRPYLFKSPFGFSFHFELYKRDSFFLNIRSGAGVTYTLNEKQSGSILFQFEKTNLLNVDTNAVKLSMRLPDMADVTNTGITFGYQFNNTNYRFNPRKGNELNISAAFAQKKVRKNSSILDIKDTRFNYSKLYDTVKLNGYSVKIKLEAAHYFAAGKQSTVKTAVNSGWLQSPNYFQNELFQLGGFKLLRGFDEEIIFSNQYVVGTVEYRYLLAQNSNFYVFTDFGPAAYKGNSGNYSHNYFSAGAGIAFETAAGIFNIAYAVGKRDDAKFDLRQSKIHIGFITVF